AVLHIPDLHNHTDMLANRIAEIFREQGRAVERGALAAALGEWARQAKHQLMDAPDA
ncbi:MAG: hypothetical protein H7251_11930, partial [Acetobacteraceae bacterium]|nr:hypothetical protein [Acetobacteraceae bacterium]